MLICSLVLARIIEPMVYHTVPCRRRSRYFLNINDTVIFFLLIISEPNRRVFCVAGMQFVFCSRAFHFDFQSGRVASYLNASRNPLSLRNIGIKSRTLELASAQILCFLTGCEGSNETSPTC